MALEMNAYFVTNLSLGDLLALLEKSGEFTIEGDAAHGLGAVAVSDICSEADQEMVEASAGSCRPPKYRSAFRRPNPPVRIACCSSCWPGSCPSATWMAR
ncbi:hypothetical protein ACFSZS_15915 [Seohaeicola zhoushanensis]